MSAPRRLARPCGLACSGCSTAAELRREITDLKAEIREWERQAREAPLGDLSETRIADVRARLGVAGQIARMLVAFLAHPGVLLTKERLLDAMAADSPAHAERILHGAFEDAGTEVRRSWAETQQIKAVMASNSGGSA